MFSRKLGLLLIPLLFSLLLLLVPTTIAQNTQPTETALPTATPVSEIIVIQATPVPTPSPQGTSAQIFWQAYGALIIGGLITAIIGGIFVGVFLKSIAEKLQSWVVAIFHLLFDRFASAPLIRLRYEKVYREAIAHAVQDLQGGKLVDRKIRLDQMYVPALLTEELKPDFKEEKLGKQFLTRQELRRRQKDRAVQPWDAVKRFNKFVVLGAPGIGKTTYLHHLTYMCAKQLRPEVKEHIPIFIRFRELVRDLDKIEKLEDVLPEKLAEYQFPNAARFIEQRLNKGQCFLLLDGLDELSNQEEQQRFIDLIEAFANRYVRDNQEKEGSKNILVVSSRKYSYEHGPQINGFEKTEVMEFDQNAIASFLYNWFAEEGEIAAECLALLKKNNRFLELARNPLLLLLIAYHYQRERNLPEIRAELYRDCIRTRVIKWNTTRGTHRGRFGEERKMRLLRDLALFIFEQNDKGLVWRQDLLAWVNEFSKKITLIDGTTAEDLLEEVAITSGLLQEWAIDRYGFSHQTLQEFFAADAINRLGPEQGMGRLSPHLDKPIWKEVILLYAGLADNAQPLLQALTADTDPSLDVIRRMLLAGDCMEEGAQSVSFATRVHLTETLFSYLRSNEVAQLTEAEKETVIRQLRHFAPTLMPQLIEQLLNDAQPDVLLAERLLPSKANDALRLKVRLAIDNLINNSEDAKELSPEESIQMSNARSRLGGDDAQTAKLLIEQLDDADSDVRREAIYGFAQMGHVKAEWVPVLLRMLEDAQDGVRHAALAVLLEMGQAEKVGMVHIPAGEFLMGSAHEDKDAKDNEKPQHTVYLPDYFMDRTPVTNGQYRQFMEAGGYEQADYWVEAIEAGRWANGRFTDYAKKARTQPIYWDNSKWNGDPQPVVGVTWYEAMAYARWAGKRLPSEAEWEKAARGTDGRIYPWGNEWNPKKLNSKEANLKKTTPVGQFFSAGDNLYGVVDMVGNVWQWCSTRYWDENNDEINYPYSANDGREDLSGGDKIPRRIRGGSWAENKNNTRVGFRNRYYPNDRSINIGFRCCATSSGSDS